MALGRRGIATWWGDFYADGPIERLGLEPEGVAADRADPLQHGRRGRPARGRAAPRSPPARRPPDARAVHRRGAPDVAIIGGGIVGTALAAELAGRGARVTLYERRGRSRPAPRAATPASSGTRSIRCSRALYRETLARYRTLADELAAELPPDASGRAFRLAAEPAGILRVGRDEARCARRPRRSPAAPGLRTDVRRRARRSRASSPPWRRRPRRPCASTIGFPVAPGVGDRGVRRARPRRAARRSSRASRPRVARSRARRAIGVERGRRRRAAGAVVVAAGPWTPEVVDPSGAWRPIRPFWGVVVELELERPPRPRARGGRHRRRASTPDGGAGRRRGRRRSTSASSPPPAGRSLGSTFLPTSPTRAARGARSAAGGARYVPGDRGRADARAAGLRPAARARRPPAGRRRSRAWTACSSPRATGRGGSRPGRRPRATSPRWCWVTRIRGGPEVVLRILEHDVLRRDQLRIGREDPGGEHLLAGSSSV